MPMGQNQLAGTRFVTIGLRHVDKWIYWSLTKGNLGKICFIFEGKNITHKKEVTESFLPESCLFVL